MGRPKAKTISYWARYLSPSGCVPEVTLSTNNKIDSIPKPVSNLINVNEEQKPE